MCDCVGSWVILGICATLIMFLFNVIMPLVNTKHNRNMPNFNPNYKNCVAVCTLEQDNSL